MASEDDEAALIPCECGTSVVWEQYEQHLKTCSLNNAQDAVLLEEDDWGSRDASEAENYKYDEYRAANGSGAHTAQATWTHSRNQGNARQTGSRQQSAAWAGQDENDDDVTLDANDWAEQRSSAAEVTGDDHHSVQFNRHQQPQSGAPVLINVASDKELDDYIAHAADPEIQLGQKFSPYDSRGQPSSIGVGRVGNSGRSEAGLESGRTSPSMIGMGRVQIFILPFFFAPL